MCRYNARIMLDHLMSFPVDVLAEVGLTDSDLTSDGDFLEATCLFRDF